MVQQMADAAPVEVLEVVARAVDEEAALAQRVAEQEERFEMMEVRVASPSDDRLGCGRGRHREAREAHDELNGATARRSRTSWAGWVPTTTHSRAR
jgi:hypothetical protein